MGTPPGARLRRSSAGGCLHDRGVRLAGYDAVRRSHRLHSVRRAGDDPRRENGDAPRRRRRARGLGHGTRDHADAACLGRRSASARPTARISPPGRRSLYCAVRAFETHLRRDYVWLGIALGAAAAHARPRRRADLRRRDVRARPGAPLPLARGAVAVVPRCGHHVRPVLDLEFDARLGDDRVRAGQPSRAGLEVVPADLAVPRRSRGVFARAVGRCVG